IGPGEWAWLDMQIDAGDTDEVLAMTTRLSFDPLAVRDAVEDVDLPKVDDFSHHLVVILHGLSVERVATYEVDAFIASNVLVTVHREKSPSIDALWQRAIEVPDLAQGTVDELLARVADTLTRRLLAVLDAFDDRSDELIERALAADPTLISDLMAVRSDVVAVRKTVIPQREALDVLRSSSSPLVSDAGRRRFSDVFDVAARAAEGLDSARSSLAEILDAYRGAEAREATDVTKVLTIYAAIMLPLSLVAGFFGMNFTNLPGTTSQSGWIVATIIMVVIAVVSLGVFVTLGWMRRPSGRRAGALLGRGLIEAARAPAQIVGAAYEISTLPLRSSVDRVLRGDSDGR
ncbi:MAG: magnesium transporter CorA family protein, partial [Acidimicrobiia bacterium]|nr:magnesium transporter CorA family protein [Acidimicrobiia bacterium]